MKRGNLKKLVFVVALCMFLNGMVAVVAQAEGEYSFNVHNTTDTLITQIFVSENGTDWGMFDIGRGIPAGATATLVWDESTDDENCSQLFKAVFSDGTESESVIFDFCEEGLELEF
jgi:hypothetical protein